MKRISLGLVAAAGLVFGAAACSQNSFGTVAVTKDPQRRLGLREGRGDRGQARPFRRQLRADAADARRPVEGSQHRARRERHHRPRNGVPVLDAVRRRDRQVRQQRLALTHTTP